MTRTSYKITGKALAPRDMETVLPGSAKVVACGLMEVARVIKAASKKIDKAKRD